MYHHILISLTGHVEVSQMSSLDLAWGSLNSLIGIYMWFLSVPFQPMNFLFVFWGQHNTLDHRDDCMIIMTKTARTTMMIMLMQGVSIHRHLCSLLVPRISRRLLLHKEEWVFHHHHHHRGSLPSVSPPFSIVSEDATEIFLSRPMAAKTIVRWNPSLSEQVAKRPGRYDEMPKSATMENRQNMEQHVRADFFLWIFWFPSSTLYFVQFYATVQRQKNPGLTPFSSGYEVDTIEQLKRAVRSQVKNVRSQVAKKHPQSASR